MDTAMDRQLSSSALESPYIDLERLALRNTTPQEKPRAILLGGQPGSGKSEIASMAAQELNARGGAVVIDADQLREMNPAYKKLSRTDPQNAADLTHKEAAE